jgi:hypothetical protein
MSSRVRVISVLASFQVFVFVPQTQAAATSVPHQLYGKSVSVYLSTQTVLEEETTGKMTTVSQ